MDLPEKCPQCNAKWNEAIEKDGKASYPFLNIRTELDFDFNGGNSDARIEDQIYECSECHTLFRVRWQLLSFIQLIEKNEAK